MSRNKQKNIDEQEFISCDNHKPNDYIKDKTEQLFEEDPLKGVGDGFDANGLDGDGTPGSKRSKKKKPDGDVPGSVFVDVQSFDTDADDVKVKVEVCEDFSETFDGGRESEKPEKFGAVGMERLRTLLDAPPEEPDQPDPNVDIKMEINDDFAQTYCHSKPENSETPQFFKCQVCDKFFQTWQKLKIHAQIHLKPYECRICGKTFSQHVHLKNHNLSHTGERPYKCEVCDKSFSRPDRLKEHRTIHTGEKPHECLTCGKTFRRLNNLQEHSLIHVEKTPHKCDICGKGFSYIKTFKRHYLIHTMEEPFKCEICGVVYLSQNGYKNHQMTHTGEKPYVCEICEKPFSMRDVLNRHIKTHESLLRCEKCNLTFRNPASLARHELTHTEYNPNKCEICGKSCPNEGSLSRHRLAHDKKQPTCDPCGKSFSCTKNYNRHLRSSSHIAQVLPTYM